MINSKKKVLAVLRRGGYISKGNFSGHWLNIDGKRVRLNSLIVRELENEGAIVYKSDGSRVGATWVISLEQRKGGE